MSFKSMSTNFERVRQFHNRFGAKVGNFYQPEIPDQTTVELRKKLIEEEYAEFLEALAANNIVGVADALGDLLYVVYGTAVSFGINADTVVEEIHRSNMSKLDENGQPIYRDDGKVLKGPNYTPPNVRKVLGL